MWTLWTLDTLWTLRQAVTPPRPAASANVTAVKKSASSRQPSPARPRLSHTGQFLLGLYVATGLGTAAAAVCVTWISGHRHLASSVT